MKIVVIREAWSGHETGLTFYRWLENELALHSYQGYSLMTIRTATSEFIPSFRWISIWRIINTKSTWSLTSHLRIGRFGIDIRPSQWRALQCPILGLVQEFAIQIVCGESTDPRLEKTGMKPGEKLLTSCASDTVTFLPVRIYCIWVVPSYGLNVTHRLKDWMPTKHDWLLHLIGAIVEIFRIHFQAVRSKAEVWGRFSQKERDCWLNIRLGVRMRYDTPHQK